MTYLPIGSVVLLNNGQKKLMIYGRRQIAKDSGVAYDYIGCLFPEGNISDEFTYLFNRDDVREVVYEGLSNDEELEFQKVLQETENQ